MPKLLLAESENFTYSGSSLGGNVPPTGQLEEVKPPINVLPLILHVVRSSDAQPSTPHTQTESAAFVDIEQKACDTVI